MKNLFYICGLLLFFSCSNTEKPLQYTPLVSIDSLMTSQDNFLSYYFSKVDLSSPYTPIDEKGQIVPKLDFLNAIESGNFFPVEVNFSSKAYQLRKLDSLEKKKYKKFLSAKAQQYKQYARLLGSPFQNFEFRDINGTLYNNTSLKGKIVVIKFWFLNCKPCIEEIPALNKLADTYKDRDDVVFLSFALDGTKALQKFKMNNEYSYKTISAKDFVLKDLKVQVFPTHMIMNKKGVITFVDGQATYLENALKKELQG